MMNTTSCDGAMEWYMSDEQSHQLRGEEKEEMLTASPRQHHPLLLSRPRQPLCVATIAEDIFSFAELGDILRWRLVCSAWYRASPQAFLDSEDRVQHMENAHQNRCRLFLFPDGSDSDAEEQYSTKRRREPAEALKRKTKALSGYESEDMKLLSVYMYNFFWYRFVPMAAMPLLLAIPTFTPLFFHSTDRLSAAATELPNITAPPLLVTEELASTRNLFLGFIDFSQNSVSASWGFVVGTVVHVAMLWIASFLFCWTWIQHTVPISNFSVFLGFSVFEFFMNWGLMISMASDLSVVEGSKSMKTLLFEDCQWFVSGFAANAVIAAVAIALYSHYHWSNYRALQEKVRKEHWRRECMLAAIKALRVVATAHDDERRQVGESLLL